MPFLVKEMKTRGKVSAVDCLNSLIWLKRQNCFWTRTPEDRYGNREHRRKLIERWAREGRFDKLAQWVQATNLSDEPEERTLGYLPGSEQPGPSVAGASGYPPHGRVEFGTSGSSNSGR